MVAYVRGSRRGIRALLSDCVGRKLVSLLPSDTGRRPEGGYWGRSGKVWWKYTNWEVRTLACFCHSTRPNSRIQLKLTHSFPHQLSQARGHGALLRVTGPEIRDETQRTSVASQRRKQVSCDAAPTVPKLRGNSFFCVIIRVVNKPLFII